MPLFLDTRGRSTLGVGICDRCSRKFPIGDLVEDPNAPGMRVCKEDRDVLDPYRLPPRQPDNTLLPSYRPDVSVAVDYNTALADEATYGQGRV
jgi:hypothetical protein